MKALCLMLAVAALVLVAEPRAALASTPDATLMTRLGAYAQAFETMKTHASYTVTGNLVELASDGNADGRKELTARVIADGSSTHLDVLRYIEDGADKTADARQKAADHARESRAKKKPKKNYRMPFHPDEQARYVFDQTESDAQDPARVRITFVPKEPAEDTIEGSAWVDTRAGTIVTAGFKMSQPPSFVDYVHMTIEFAAPTSLGPAVSRVSLDGRGGILFFRKSFRAEAILSAYTITP